MKDNFFSLPSLQVSANDVDYGVNRLVRYSIKTGNDNYCFAIDDDTGIITVIKRLDREKVIYMKIMLSLIYFLVTMDKFG